MCLVVLQADWVTMNYVPFGEKALTMVVNLYQQTAHDMSVIQFNILHNIIEVCYSLLASMLCKVNYCSNPVVCLFVGLFLCVKDVASIVQSVKSGNLNHFCSSLKTFHMMKLLSLHDCHTVERWLNNFAVASSSVWFFKVEFHTQNSYFTSTFILWALYLGNIFLHSRCKIISCAARHEIWVFVLPAH